MHAEALAMGISSIDFMWMTPREYQLFVKMFLHYRKYANADLLEAKRISTWHLCQSKANYNDFKKNHFPLSIDNDETVTIKEIISSEDYIKEKDDISKIHQQISKSLNK